MVSDLPSLKALHSDSSLSQLKLEHFRKLSDEELTNSLRPGQSNSLRARPDGTIVEGHHRLKILSERGVDIDLLPREVIERDLL
jgi:hypothetical protein